MRKLSLTKRETAGQRLAEWPLAVGANVPCKRQVNGSSAHQLHQQAQIPSLPPFRSLVSFSAPRDAAKGVSMRLKRGGREATRIITGASLIVGMAVGCGNPSSVSHSSSATAIITAVPKPIAVALASGRPAPTTSKSARSKRSGAASSQAPTQATPEIAFTASCPADGSTSTSGCGSWDAGPTSGQAAGFAAGQQSFPALYAVNQDPWHGGQGPQVVTASSFQDWSVTATDTDPPGAAGEVLTYPDASVNYYQLNTEASGYSTPPTQYDLNNITSLTSDFTESMPQLSDLDAEATYDIWLNSWQTQVMVWVETSPGKDRNLADSGDTEVGTYTYGGQDFSLWRNGSGVTGSYFFLLDHNETSGTVDLEGMLETMVSLGYIPATSPLTQIAFGWEISDTGGEPVTFSMSGFDVNLQN